MEYANFRYEKWDICQKRSKMIQKRQEKKDKKKNPRRGVRLG